MIKKSVTILILVGLSGCTTITRRADHPKGVYQPTDTRIQSSLDVDFIKLGAALYTQICLKVFKGRVLLAGRVPSVELQKKAEEIARSTPGVLEVYNKTTIGSSRNGEEYLEDGWIATTMARKIFMQSGIFTDNYVVEVVDGMLYILGEAKNEEERSTVLDLARNIKGVKKVYSFIKTQS